MLAASASAAFLSDERAPHGELLDSLTSEGLHWRGDAGGAELGLSLASWGRGASRAAVAPAIVEHDGAQVNYVRGGVVEWYAPHERGLGQGFVVQRAPAADGDGALVLVQSVCGSLAPEVSSGARDLVLRANSGEIVMSYTGLAAWDASGRELDARLEIEGRDVAIVVDDARAVYPIQIDPLIAFEQSRLEPQTPSAGDQHGYSVDVDGDTAVVGAYLDDWNGVDSGSAFVYVREGATWTRQATLLASDLVAGDQFGTAVAIQGDTIVVGAAFEDHGFVNVGAAYVFVRSGNTWTQQAKLVASDGLNHDHFGNWIDIDGDTVVIGSFEDDSPATDSGSVYVFVRDGVTWTQQQKLLSSDLALADRFGRCVAISGDTIAIGAYLDDDLGEASGSAYVFKRTGSTWSQQQKLLAYDGVARDDFGISIDVDGDTLAVGMYRDDDLGNNSGSAYVYTRAGAVWTLQQKLLAGDGAAFHDFGWTLSLDGDRLLVGAPQGIWQANTGRGAAYTFKRAGATWTQEAKLVASDGSNDDFFGACVALSGATCVSGAYLDDVVGVDSGSAYAYLVGAPGEGLFATPPQSLLAGNAPTGIDVADVDANGARDVVLSNSGDGSLAFLANDGAGNLAAPTHLATGGAPLAVAVGDLDADGLDDLVAAVADPAGCPGTPHLAPFRNLGGGLFAGLAASPTGPRPADLALVDLDLDGKLDAVVANSEANAGGCPNESVSIHLGLGDGTFASASHVALGVRLSAIAADDVDHDGRPDVVVASNAAGAITVLLGNGLGGLVAHATIAVGTGPRDVALGDLDGDGQLDAVVAHEAPGRATVLIGDGLGGFVLERTIGLASSARSVALADVDLEGRLDVLTTHPSTGTLGLLLAEGDGSFRAAIPTSFGLEPRALAAADLDGDGDVEALASDALAGALAVLRGLVDRPNVHEGVTFPSGASSFADAVIAYEPAHGGGATPIAPFASATAAIGEPDAAGATGARTTSLGSGGRLALGFTDNRVENDGGDGAELHVFETGLPYETIAIAVRPSGVATLERLLAQMHVPDADGYFAAGVVRPVRNALDLDAAFPGFAAGELRFDAVRASDDPLRDSTLGASVGADVDAIGAIRSVAPLADLRPASITLPASGITGRNANVAWSARNVGDGVANPAWSDRIVLSIDAVLGNGDDVVLGTSAGSSALAVGDTYGHDVAFTLAAAPATYRAFVVVDATAVVAEGSESNNALISVGSIEIAPFPDCNANGIDDLADIAGASEDCDGNGVPDECQSAADCDDDGTPDFCEILGGAVDTHGVAPNGCAPDGIPDSCQPAADCDDDGTPDFCEILAGAIDTHGIAPNGCTPDGIPDSCQPAADCDDDGTPDFCEILAGAVDTHGVAPNGCTPDGIPDSCQPAADCDDDGTPDFCEILAGAVDTHGVAPNGCAPDGIPDSCQPAADCDDDGTPDFCEILAGAVDTHGIAPNGCAPDGIPDSCQPAADCDDDGTPDFCEILAGAVDTHGVAPNGCTPDGIPDSCQPAADCDDDGTPDFCEILAGAIDTHGVAPNGCAPDGIPDSCQPAADCDDDGTPDFCEILAGAIDTHGVAPNGCTPDGIPDSCQPAADCDDDGTPDFCEILAGAIDTHGVAPNGCTPDGIPDSCQPAADCDDDGTPDFCEILGGAVDTHGIAPNGCTPDGIPDSCQPAADCDDDGTPDFCEILAGAIDTHGVAPNGCTPDGIPDSCQPAADCDNDGTSDFCEILAGAVDTYGVAPNGCTPDGIPDPCQPAADCDNDGTPDFCEILGGAVDTHGVAPNGCAPDGIPDSCQPAADCDDDGTPDFCEILAGAIDTHGVAPNGCTPDGIPDSCQPAADCDNDGTPDFCELGADCNANGIPDACDIASGTSHDIDLNSIPDECQAPGISFCLGDGSGTACPCGNSSPSTPAAGCLNSTGLGARLVASGVASVAADTLLLQGTQMPATTTALYIQGTSTSSGGAGTVFGDGLRCVAGSVVRLGTRTNSGGTSSYPGPGGEPISTRGLIPPTGGTRYYQVWFRNAAAFCTPATWNLSQGLSVTWQP